MKLTKEEHEQFRKSILRFFDGIYKERIGYDFYCDIAERVVEGRKKNGWTQEQLAIKSGLPIHRLACIETVRIRTTLDDVKKLSKALGVSEDWLIQADLKYGGKKCLYLLWVEKYEDSKIYQEASSARMAFLMLDAKFRGIVRWLEPRDRVIVELKGVPLSQEDLEARYPKRTNKDEDDPIESPKEDAG